MVEETRSSEVRVFEANGKLNVVDENNVFVGFDYSADCCEHFGYFFSKHVPEKIQEESEVFNHEEFVFDSSWFKSVEMGSYDSDNMAVFRLVNPKGEEMFLALFNSHNGYYGHGFTVSIKGEIVREGTL